MNEKLCECAKPFIADPTKPETQRSAGHWNRWPECRACGRPVRVERAAFIGDHPISGTVQ